MQQWITNWWITKALMDHVIQQRSSKVVGFVTVQATPYYEHRDSINCSNASTQLASMCMSSHHKDDGLCSCMRVDSWSSHDQVCFQVERSGIGYRHNSRNHFLSCFLANSRFQIWTSLHEQPNSGSYTVVLLKYHLCTGKNYKALQLVTPDQRLQIHK